MIVQRVLSSLSVRTPKLCVLQCDVGASLSQRRSLVGVRLGVRLLEDILRIVLCLVIFSFAL